MSSKTARTPKKLFNYVDASLGCETFSISGVNIVVQSSDESLLQLVRTHWGPFQIETVRAKHIHAVFQFSDGDSPPLSKLRSWQSFLSKNFLFLSDGKRYLLTGYLYDYPWQFHCRRLPDWNSEFVYYYVFEPVLIDLLKRLDVLVWHSAAVARNGSAILLPGVSGAGKSTTTLNLLNIGYAFIADDLVLLKRTPKGLEVSGFETGLYLTNRSLELLPEWNKLKSGRRFKRGQRWKHRIDLSKLRPKPGSKDPRATTLLFPQVTAGKKTRLERMRESDALLECLRQSPKEFPATILGGGALENQFEIYAQLVKSKRCYRIHLGSDQDEVRAVLNTL